MRAGDLRSRITIQKRGPAKDAAGQIVDGWAEVATVWADVRHQSGMQAIKAGSPISKVAASVRIRHRQEVEGGMRLLFDGRVYGIQAVMHDPGRVFTDLVCEVVE